MFLKTVLALLFIIKLRKVPDNLPNYIRTLYGEQGYKKFRNYGNTHKKLAKASLDIEFLNKCKVYNVILKFLHFKLYKKCLISAAFHKKWQSKLLINEIKSKKRTEQTLSTQLSSAALQIKSAFSCLDSCVVFRHVTAVTKDFKRATARTHNTKLSTLGIDSGSDLLCSDKVISNFSSVIIPCRIKFY